MRIALVHDYLTQRGGAERVALSLTRAFPGAPLYTSLHDPDGTFPEFGDVDVRALPLNALPVLRHRHRLALPFLATAFSRLRVEADVVICSSSGWAHGARVTGRKLVYCHTPARWLYQGERYLGEGASAGRIALGPLRRALLRWDAAAAASADRYLTNSSEVKRRIREIYAIEAETVPPPQTIDVNGSRREVPGIGEGFILCVSRLLPYKNVAAVVEAFEALPEHRLLIAGVGPDQARLRARAPANVRLLGAVGDDELRMLYACSSGLVAASFEDYGLTPLEAAAFGKPVAVLRFGGFTDTVVESETGIFFDSPAPAAIAEAVRKLGERSWSEEAIRAHAERYSEARFIEHVRRIAEETARTPA